MRGGEGQGGSQVRRRPGPLVLLGRPGLWEAHLVTRPAAAAAGPAQGKLPPTFRLRRHAAAEGKVTVIPNHTMHHGVSAPTQNKQAQLHQPYYIWCKATSCQPHN